MSEPLRSKIFSSTEISQQVREQQAIQQEYINTLKKAYEQGSDISEYVWPPEWDLRNRPKPHHIGHIISLADAIDVCGQHLHGTTWHKEDWYARSPEEIKEWNPVNNLRRALNYSANKKGADFTNRPEEEKQAFSRKQEVYGILSSWLNQARVEAFTLDDKGNRGSIHANIWLAHNALNILNSGKISDQKDGKTKSDFVYLNKEQLEKALNKAKSYHETKEREELKPKGITCPEGIWSQEAIILLSNKDKGEAGLNMKMGKVSQSFIHFLITTPDLEIFTIDSGSGKQRLINRDYLRTQRAIEDFIRGWIPSDNFRASDDDGEYIFINRVQFENFLADKPIVENPVPNEIGEIANPSYMPAYLGFMLKALKVLNLSADKRTNADDIRDWLDKNWPSDLEGKSKNMIKYMTTFLRRPEDKKGGNTPHTK